MKIKSKLFLSLICMLPGILTFSQTTVTWGISDSRTETKDNAGAQGGMSGFYETNAPVNYPAGATGWWHLLDIRHHENANNYAMQFAGSFFDGNLFFRKTNNSASAGWSRVVMDGNYSVNFVNLQAGSTNPVLVTDGIIRPATVSDDQSLQIFATRVNIGQINSYAFDPANTALHTIRSLWDGTDLLRYSVSSGLSYVTMKQIGTSFFDMNFVQNNTSQLFLSSNSKIGMGTTNPLSNLHIKGDAYTGAILETTSSTTGSNITFKGTTGNFSSGLRDDLGVTGAYAITDNTAGLSRFLITSAGNAGIGTVTPSQKLDVAGNIHTSGKILVNQTTIPSSLSDYMLLVNGPAIFTKAVVKLNANWPDYVFAKDYQLPTLTSIEQYIKENSHLPGVASAQEVADKGIDLGDNQAVLLKKVEELTLYLIEMDKEMKQVKKENIEMKEALKKITEKIL